MVAATPFLAASDSPLKPNHTDIPSVVEDCLERTAQALHESGAASSTVLTNALASARERIETGRPTDLIETVARALGNEEEHMGRAILELGDKVATTLYPSPSLIPFGAKLIAPSAFYDSFEQLHKLARALLSPVIYAEDTDAVGTATINPIAGVIFAEEIAAVVSRRFGIRPFVTVARLDYENWAFLIRKHFEL